MKWIKWALIAMICYLPNAAQAQFESFRDSVVQLYGVIMTADSLRALEGTSISVVGQNRGTIANREGVFSLAVMKGDKIEFTFVGFHPKTVEIPKNLEGNQFSIIQLMVVDPTFLPATIIKPRPTREQFERDFVNLEVDDDAIETARKNTESARRRALMMNTPADGVEMANYNLRKSSRQMYYTGQAPPQNIFNPLAWSEFVQAWKRGDFKKKN